jgi:phosphohistidine swiveling domain-containing protein
MNADAKRIVSCREPITERAVGGKFSKQKAMLDAGLAVPAFFCLTAAFYEDVFRPLRPAAEAILARIDFADAASIQSAARALGALFESVALSGAQLAAVLGAFDAHFAEGTLVSVRASTVGHRREESEDSKDNAFAGMSETFLYVRRDQISARLKACWASGFSPESLLYRHAQGMSLLGFGVAVGVQRMIFGERSFVLFTSNPSTAARDFVIVAGHGIGEGVVQEKVEVDHYFVNGKTGAVTRDVQPKTRRLTLDAAAGHGLVEAAVPVAQRDAPCLDDAEIAALVAEGRRIEALFGCPQDVEGTFTATGELYFLQSRPIAFDYGRQRVWTNTNVTESYPGVTTPLTYTFAKYFYRTIFFDLYRMLGVPGTKLHDNLEPLDRMIGFLGGRVYYCLSHFYLLHKQSPMFPVFASHWENMIGLSTSYQTGESATLEERVEKLRAWAQVPPAAVATAYQYATHERRMSAFHAWWDALMADLRGRDLSREDPMALRNRFFDIWTQVGNQWGVTLTTDAYLIPLYGLLESLFKKWRLSDEDPGLLSDLLCGDEKLMSVEILLSAVALAEQVRASPTLLAQLESNDDLTVWKMAQRGELDEAFTRGLTRHLHQFGDRGLQELKLEQPALRDTPWVLVRMIQTYAQQAVTVASVRAHEARVRKDADATLARKLRAQPAKRALLAVLLPRLRRLIGHRENSRYCRAELFGVSRKIFLGIAADLVRRGVLGAIDDVYYLTQDEVMGYVDGTGVTENLQALADLRRKEHAANLRRELPEQITTLGAVRSNALEAPPAVLADPGTLRGLGSSAGKVRGTARVVLDPNTIGAIEPDMILVARETDPGWLFLMLASKGMVVERGSMLSHTAITGRKFGIPTIVALPGATARIPDGAAIEIDGSTGLVTILSVPRRPTPARAASVEVRP